MMMLMAVSATIGALAYVWIATIVSDSLMKELEFLSEKAVDHHPHEDFQIPNPSQLLLFAQLSEKTPRQKMNEIFDLQNFFDQVKAESAERGDNMEERNEHLRRACDYKLFQLGKESNQEEGTLYPTKQGSLFFDIPNADDLKLSVKKMTEEDDIMDNFDTFLIYWNNLFKTKLLQTVHREFRALEDEDSQVCNPDWPWPPKHFAASSFYQVMMHYWSNKQRVLGVQINLGLGTLNLDRSRLVASIIVPVILNALLYGCKSLVG